jgi:IS30 family transposase
MLRPGEDVDVYLYADPVDMRKSINGLSVSDQSRAVLKRNVWRFRDPRSLGLGGTNENTYRLLRQYFPKKTNLPVRTQSGLNKVANRLNQRPSEALGYIVPGDILSEIFELSA